MVAKNWSSLLIEVTISKLLFVVMPENGIFCEFGFPNGILWEFSHLHLIYYEVSKCLLYLYLDIIPTRNTDTLERVSVSKWHHVFFERYEHYILKRTMIVIWDFERSDIRANWRSKSLN